MGRIWLGRLWLGILAIILAVNGWDLVTHEPATLHEFMWRRYGDYLANLKGPAYRDHVFAYIEAEDNASLVRCSHHGRHVRTPARQRTCGH